ncbi:sugar-binding protein [Kribbella sp. NPDC004875]|uniref:sugar-binding protein n=1 Tax=Kribbella sp. NPDC004875 TaxID=3364107 RepID=UPI0036A5FD12
MKRRTFLGVGAATAGAALVHGSPLSAAAGTSGSTALTGLSGPQALAASNVFVAPAVPRLVVPNAQPGEKITVTVTAPGGDRIWSGTARGASSGATTVVVPVGPGYYDVDYSTQSGTSTDSFCVLSKLAGVVPGLGVNTHFGFGPDPWDPNVLAPMVAAAGIAIVRDTQEWWGAESAKGTYDFTLYTTYHDVLVGNGLTDLPVLSFNNANYDGGATPYTDAGRSGFAQYAVELVRQNPKVAAVEVFNEFNIPTFGARGNSPANCQPDYYFLLLKATVTELRKHYPHLRYVAPATAGVPLDWMKVVFDSGGLDYIDGVSIHPYNYPASPDSLAQQIRSVATLIESYGVQRDIWISELGWPAGTAHLAVDTRSQAAYAVQGAAAAYAAGVTNFFWYDFMNDGTNPAETEQNFGMVKMVSGGASRPKPAYVSYANLARQISGAARGTTPTGLKQDSPVDAVSRVVIPNGAATTWMLWADSPTPFAVEAARSATFTDTYGDASRVEGADGLVSLTLGKEPVYLSATGALAVASTVRHQLTAKDTKRGENLTATWVFDNSTGKRRASATLVSGRQVVASVSVPAGGKQSTEVSFGPATTVGRRTVHASVTESSAVVGKLVADYEVAEPLSLAVQHVLKDGTDQLRIRVSNDSSAAQTASTIAWTVGSAKDSASNVSIAAGAVDERFISLTGVSGGTSYDVTTRLSDGTPLNATGKVVIVAAADLHHAARKTIEINGVNQLAGTTPTGSSNEGNVVVTGYNGPQDLSFDLWVTHDADKLYLTVAVTDDVLHATAGGDQVWQNDSLQFSVSSGTPGEAQSWNEIGASLVGSDVDTWRWSGPATGPLPAGDAAIVRSGTTTTYTTGVAWTDLGIDPTGTLISVSMLVNDNDGQGRKGYIEWGSGIGNGKDSALFKAFVLDA